MISVIIPTYKTDIATLKRAVDSVYKQNMGNWELIIVDDNPQGSEWKVNNKKFFEKLDKSRTKFIFHETNQGANCARNTGVRSAEGDIVAFLDSDDEWDVNYLKEVDKAFADKEVGIVASDLVICYPDHMEKQCSHHQDGYIYDDLIYSDIVGQTSAVAVRRDVLIKAGMFDETLPARQDYDAWLRVCKISKIKYIRKILVYLHCDNHIRISTGGNNHINGTLMVLDKLLSLPELKDKAKEIQFAHTKYVGMCYLRKENYKEGRKYLQKSLQFKFSVKVLAYYLLAIRPGIWRLVRGIRRKLRFVKWHFQRYGRSSIYKTRI